MSANDRKNQFPVVFDMPVAPKPVWVIVIELVIGAMITVMGVLAVVAAYVALANLW